MTITEWAPYAEAGKTIYYKCNVCKCHSGKMMMRNVTETNAGTHREFRIVCDSCDHKGSVHWSKTLAEATWNAEGNKDV